MITEPIVLTFTKDKDTKNTVKYEEDARPNDGKLVGSLYLQKHVANGHDKIRLTIHPVVTTPAKA